MSVSLSIYTYADNLDMHGEPDVQSAYSLSGHITISLSSSASFFDRRRTGRYLLQSLSLTFEGQSEIFTPTLGYSAARLCSITRELVPSGSALELSNEGHEESAEPCVWNIVFNMTVPGWLPASSALGVEEVGVRYGLYATAKLLDLDENKTSTWSFTTFCAPFRSKTKSVFGQKLVKLRRFVAPPSQSSPTLGTINYHVKNPSASIVEGKRRMPSEVIEKIQVVLSTPQVIDIDKKKMDVTLRLRSNGLEECVRKSIRLLDVTLDLRQHEKCRTRPSRSYKHRYPLPPLEQQPPSNPLLDPAPVGSIYDVGILQTAERSECQSRSFALAPSRQSSHFKFDENTALIFANDPNASHSGEQSNWYNLEMKLPFTRKAIVDDDWDISAALRPSASTPLFVVHHELTVGITCSYTFLDTNEVVLEKLGFTVSPLFGHITPPSPQPTLPSPASPDNETPSHSVPSLPVVGPYAPVLPIYSQLYDMNGNVKIDYSVPLPLYTPPENATDPTRGRPTSLPEVMDPTSDSRRWKDATTRETLDDDSDSDEISPLLGTSSVQPVSS